MVFFFFYTMMVSMSRGKLMIYTDGAARGNPGPAGWGVVVVNREPLALGKGPEVRHRSYQPPKREVTSEFGGKSKRATNNQMELTAAIRALEYAKEKNLGLPLEIYADSKYVLLGVTEWIKKWVANGWKTAAKKPVLNEEMWRELHALSEDLKPTWFYVEGHSGDIYNERADEIATAFADGLEDKINLKKP